MKINLALLLALLAFNAHAADNFVAGETITVAASTTSNSATFSLSQSQNYPDVLVINSGSIPAYFGCGGTGISAQLPAAGATNATPILAGAVMTMHKGNAAACAAITASGSSTVTFTAGQGQ